MRGGGGGGGGSIANAKPKYPPDSTGGPHKQIQTEVIFFKFFM